jgi:hypothetical protein
MGAESFDKYLKRYQKKYPGSSREKAKKAYDRALAKRKKKSDFVPLAAGRKLSSKKKETTGRTVGQADVSASQERSRYEAFKKANPTAEGAQSIEAFRRHQRTAAQAGRGAAIRGRNQ